ncbi:hypothetical protein [Burkholderia metallica]|uniref:Uncharacterized protein n=1 Tax=Burkholderia metallica TaxID=488729 RepID=A0ABT8PLC6_9BURK|nr:hypothetical protein [Burkholderia metallica]MCA8022979.1 hypothetical protein [Burkholderia metallica]MDN7935806.1 hypothetical protein [Burkholderia metallica]
MAAKRIGDRIRERGRFEPDELVRVSLDRPKRSHVAWMTRADLDEHAVTANHVDGVAHVTELRKIALLDQACVHVCPDCLDELLVRSGEQPHSPTPLSRAFDTSVVADNATVSGPLVKCDIHGIGFGSCTSPAMAAVIDRREPLPHGRLIKVVVVSPKAENEFWFDEAFLHRLLGDDVDLSSGIHRMDSDEHSLHLLESGESVCRYCLEDWLRRYRVA